jgi:periplasmic protein TonB
MDSRVITAPHLPEVYSAGEIARAAGAHPRDVQALAESGIIRPLLGGRYYRQADAVRAVRVLVGATVPERPLFRPSAGVRREPGLPIALSATAHAGMLALAALMMSFGTARTQARTADERSDLRMVYLVAPGPGGGGGGGGRKESAPPPPIERRGAELLRSPVAVHRPPPPSVTAVRDTPPPRIEPPSIVRPIDPPPATRAEAMQPVFAPIVAAASDPRDRTGMPWHPPASNDRDSHGPGTGGGSGSGQGTGLGEGNGSGVGPGSGGGTGGGPYRPGTGISAPTILREVRPDYTDEGRRRGIEGDVVLEIVVRADGNVGSVKLLQGLGAGLDQRATDAVRQWRFNPAARYGTPVDVIVEVAVEFKLR